MPLRSKVAVLRLASGKFAGSGNSFTALVAGSTRAMAFCPPSVTQAARSGPTITPCGAAPAPRDICVVLPVFGSRMPIAPWLCAVYQTVPSGAGATSCGCAPCGTSKYLTSAANAGLTPSASTATAATITRTMSAPFHDLAHDLIRKPVPAFRDHALARFTQPPAVYSSVRPPRRRRPWLQPRFSRRPFRPASRMERGS